MLSGMFSEASFQSWLASWGDGVDVCALQAHGIELVEMALPTVEMRVDGVGDRRLRHVARRSFLCCSTMNAAILLSRSVAGSHVP